MNSMFSFVYEYITIIDSIAVDNDCLFCNFELQNFN